MKTAQASGRPFSHSRKGARSRYRRRLVPQPLDGSGLASSVIKSLSLDDGTKYHPQICLDTMECWCDCADFRFRHARFHPCAGDENHLCKHLKRHIESCLRRGLLEIVTPQNEAKPDIEAAPENELPRCCSFCGVADLWDGGAALFGLCSDSGAPLPGWICLDCVTQKRKARQGNQGEKTHDY